MHHNRATEISEAFGFSLTGDLGKYLGVPLIHKRVSANGFSYVTNRLLHKLSDWKANSISLAGRITLCSSVLFTIPSYSMQTTLLPGPVCDAIDKVCRKFIWGNVDGRRKLHSCNWEKVCMPKIVGGLGFRQA